MNLVEISYAMGGRFREVRALEEHRGGGIVEDEARGGDEMLGLPVGDGNRRRGIRCSSLRLPR